MNLAATNGPGPSARPRRSVLYVPGSNAKALAKARTLPCDGLILDLEDSVAPEAKETLLATFRGWKRGETPPSPA